VAKELEKDSIFSPGQSISMSSMWTVEPSQPFERFLIVEYEGSIGILVYSRFRVTCRINGAAIISGGCLVDRKFRRSTCVSLEIEDV